MKMIFPAILLCLSVGCALRTTSAPVAISGVKEATPEVSVGQDGLTNEQRNIKERLKRDSDVGAVKHLYVFSSMSGQCILYSTLKGKVTSSGKRLSPTTIHAGVNGGSAGRTYNGVPVKVGGETQYTGEVLQDDGTYGSSIDYLYFFDTKGQYRQIYPSAATFIVVSETPLPIKNVTVTFTEAK